LGVGRWQRPSPLTKLRAPRAVQFEIGREAATGFLDVGASLVECERQTVKLS
jgi:hypothetical protein